MIKKKLVRFIAFRRPEAGILKSREMNWISDNFNQKESLHSDH